MRFPVRVRGRVPIENSRYAILSRSVSTVMNIKYTKEVLELPVKESKSYSEVLRRLGVKWNGGTQANLVKRVKALSLDTSHFLGQRSNCGFNHKGGLVKLHWSAILIRRAKGRGKETTARLRRAMLESGIPYRCSDPRCPLHKIPEWIGRPIVLQIDHIDGDWLNNERDNVRFLCPNCHAQTPNFGAKNIGRLDELAIDDLYAWGGDEYEY